MGVPCNVTWTDEQVAILKEGWDDNLSFSAIAELIFKRTGRRYTRNAVIGKFHRLGLFRGRPKRTTSPNPMPRKRRPKVSARTGQQIVAPKLAPVEPGIEADGLRDLPPEALSPNAVSIHELEEHHCRWPIGEPGAEFRCCGMAKADPAKHPYCLGHARIAYAEKQPRKLSGGFAAHYG